MIRSRGFWMVTFAALAASWCVHALESRPPRATCLWANGAPSVVFEVWGSCSTDPGLQRARDTNSESETAPTLVSIALDELRRHRWGHGWGQLGIEADLIEARDGTSCPAHVLDVLETIHTPTSRRHKLANDVVAILVRNDRVDAALRLLEDELDAVEPERVLRWRDIVARRSQLFESRAQVAAFAGNHTVALESLEHWWPTSWCGVCNDAQQARISSFRIEQLRKLERWDDVEALCVQLVADGRFDACIGEAWIDAMGELIPELSPEHALARLQAFTSSEFDAESLEHALEHWTLLRATPEERIERLEMLDGQHADSVRRELQRAPRARIEELAAPLFGKDPQTAYSVAEPLIRSGHVAVGSILERARALDAARNGDGDSRFDLDIERWTTTRARLAALER